jgi:hypothetical protein
VLGAVARPGSAHDSLHIVQRLAIMLLTQR